MQSPQSESTPRRLTLDAKVDVHDLIPYAPSGGRPENESSFATTKSPAAVATTAATETTEDNTALKVCAITRTTDTRRLNP